MLDYIVGPERPIGWAVQFWPIPAVSFVGSLAATWLCKKLALKLGIVDKPDHLVKTHKQPVAYLGGVGMLMGLIAGLLIGAVFSDPQHLPQLALKWVLAVMLGGMIACFVGLTDDLFDLRPWQKFLGQIAGAAVLILAGIKPNLSFIESAPLNLPIDPWLKSVLQAGIVIFFVLGATNSLNLLDGLDGLCGGVTVIITAAMLLLAIHLATWGYSDNGDPVRVMIALCLIGSVCGFLPFNRYPAKIFMGDAGSMLLGFVAASLMIFFAEQYPRWWMASIVVFGLPILDTGVALARRALNNRPLFVSDRGHIYDQMIDRGIASKKTVRICYILAAVYAIIGLAMSQVRTRYAAIAYVLVFVISGFVIWKKGYLKMKGLRGAIGNEHN
jgi:UDP-GlcNAc:undecaprenyl-phosphate GlcNAc-1-phosphate transferase